MVLSLATCKIESCPCGDLHVITAALVVSSFFLFSLKKEEANSVCSHPSWDLKVCGPRRAQSFLMLCIHLQGFLVLSLKSSQEKAPKRKTPSWICTATHG